MYQISFFAELLKLLKLLSLPKTTRSSFEACIIRDILVNSNHPLISTYHLRKEALTKIAQTASLETYDPHKIIFQQHEVSEKLYIVLAGTVGIYFPLNYSQSFEEAREGVQDEIFSYSVEDYKRQLRLIRQVEKTNWFGDLGLLNHGSNNSIAISETPVHLMIIEHAEYHSFIIEKELNNLYYKLKVFSYNMFSDCSANNKRILYNLSKKVNFRQNQTVVEEDQPAQDIFIIKKGNFVISKLIYDENTMAEYLSDPMTVAAQYSGQQFMRAKPKNNKRYARNTCVKVIQKNEIIGEMDVAARRNSSFTCKCENTDGGSTLSIPSEVFHYIYSVDFHFQQALRLGLRAKAQDFQERVHNISIQIQKFGDFFFFKGRQELLQEKELSMGNLGEQFALYEEKNEKDKRISTQASEAVSQLAEHIRDKEKEAKSCYDFTYFPINRNKVQLNLDKTLALSSYDYEADPAAYFSSDGKSLMQVNMLPQIIPKKHSFKSITSPLNFQPPTYLGFLHKEQIADVQANPNYEMKEEVNQEDKTNQSDQLCCDSNPNQQETEWLTEMYPFSISSKSKDDQSPISSTSISQKNPRGNSNFKEKSAFYIAQEIPLIPFKKHIELSILENEGDDSNERVQYPLLDEDLNGGQVNDSIRQSGIKKQEVIKKFDDQISEKEQNFEKNRKISSCLSQNNDSQGSPSSVTSPVFQIPSQLQNQSQFANPNTNTSSREKIDLSQSQIEPKTPIMTQSQNLSMTPNKRQKDNSSNSALTFIKKRYSMQTGREMIRDKLLQKAIDSTESMKQEIMRDRDIIVVTDFKSTGKNELKSLMEIQNLQKKMNEKQDPTKYDHRIKAQQMRVLDLNIRLREQRGKESLEQERKNKEMQFNDISEEEKRNMIKSHLERLGLKQMHISPKQTFSNRSLVGAENFTMQVEAQNEQDKAINSSMNSQENQNEQEFMFSNDDNNNKNDNFNILSGPNGYQSQIKQSQSTQDLSPLQLSRQRIQVPSRFPSGLTPRTVSRFNKSLKQTRSSPFLAEAGVSNFNKSTFFKDSRTSSFINYNEVGTLDDMQFRRQSESTSINNINSKFSFEGGAASNTQGNQGNNVVQADLNSVSNNVLPQNNTNPSQESPNIGHNRQTSQTSQTKQKKIHFRNSVDEYLQMKAHALSTNYDKKKLKSQDLPFLDSYANQLQINLKRLFYVKLQEKYGHEDSLDNMQDRIADQMLDQTFKQYLKKNKDILPQKKNLNYLYNWRNKEEQANQGASQSGQQQQQQSQQQQGQASKSNYLKDSIPSQGFSFKKQRLPLLYQNHKAQNDAAMSLHIPSPLSSNQFKNENDKQTSNSGSQHYLNSTYQKQTNNHHLNSYYSSHTEENILKNTSFQEPGNNGSSQEGRESFINRRIKQFASNMRQISQKTNETTLQFKTQTKRQVIQRKKDSQDNHDKINTNDDNLEFQTYKTTIYSTEQNYLQEQKDRLKNELIEQNTVFATNKRAEKALEQDIKLHQSSSHGNLDQYQVHTQSQISLKNEETNKMTFNQMKTLSRKNYPAANNIIKNSKENATKGLSVEEEMKELTHSIILKYGLQGRFKRAGERKYSQKK